MSEYIILFPKSVNSPNSIFMNKDMELPTKEKIKNCELEDAIDLLETLGLQRAKSYTIDDKKKKHESCMPAIKLGIILGSWGKIHCVHVPVLNFNETKAIGDCHSWKSWIEIKDNQKVSPLMKTTIMLMKNKFKNWSIYSEDISSSSICMHWNN
jgi:hypothetical protein